MSLPFLQWLRIPSYTRREDPDVLARKRRSVLRGTGAFLAILGPLFFLLNLQTGNYGLALLNVSSTLVGATILLLNRQEHYQSGTFLLIIGGNLLFFLSGLLFRNGMEYILLLTMMAAIFLLSSPLQRAFFSAISGIAFILVRSAHYSPQEAITFSLERFSVNLFVFVFCYYWILEACRSVSVSHHLEIKQKNQALEEANHARERLLSIIGHDLRGPVGNLKSSVDLMANGTLSPERLKTLLPALEQEVTAACDCLDQLLVWSATQMGSLRAEREPVLLSQATYTAEKLFCEAFERKGVRLENDIPHEATAHFDSRQLATILRNLLSNALKFTPRGGTVTLRAIREGEGWRLTVADTGVGMSQEKLHRLFALQPASSSPGTENEQGLGLGLAICREFAQANGGTLSVESEEGSGTRFHLHLPGGAQEMPAAITAARTKGL